MTETPTKLDSITADLVRSKRFIDPVEKLSSNPSQSFEFLNSAEMAAAAVPAQEKHIGKPACGWSTPEVYSLNEAMMRF